MTVALIGYYGFGAPGQLCILMTVIQQTAQISSAGRLVLGLGHGYDIVGAYW